MDAQQGFHLDQALIQSGKSCTKIDDVAGRKDRTRII